MPATVTGFLVNAQGAALAGALVTFFPLSAPFVDPASPANIVTSSQVRTRSASDGSFSLTVIGGSGPQGQAVLNGNGVPDPSLGSNGDYYFNGQGNGYLYLKQSGAWGRVFDLGPMRAVLYRIEFAERDRMKLTLFVNTGTVNLGTIVLP